ncbi:hypothetical protein GCM10009627_33050 [Curtobacterium herbarum]|uniref:Uncharacterized protein n=2 Tax=Curtobacterium herbarum TaxID=150122 RepID=A0ABN1ZHA6_9MICO
MAEPQPQPRSVASTIDLVVTITAFVLLAMAAGALVVLSWFVATLSQYGCDWESSTRECRPSIGVETAVVDGIVLALVLIGGGVLAAWLRRTRPLGWTVALATSGVMFLVVLITLGAVGAFGH